MNDDRHHRYPYAGDVSCSARARKAEMVLEAFFGFPVKVVPKRDGQTLTFTMRQSEIDLLERRKR